MNRKWAVTQERISHVTRGRGDTETQSVWRHSLPPHLCRVLSRTFPFVCLLPCAFPAADRFSCRSRAMAPSHRRAVCAQGGAEAGTLFPNGKPETEAKPAATRLEGKAVVSSPLSAGDVPPVHGARQVPREGLTPSAWLGGQRRDLPLLPTAPLGQSPRRGPHTVQKAIL